MLFIFSLKLSKFQLTCNKIDFFFWFTVPGILMPIGFHVTSTTIRIQNSSITLPPKKNFLVPFFCRNTLSLHTLTELEVVWGLDPRQKDYLFRSQLCYQQSFCAQKHLTRPSLSQRVISSFGFSQAFYCTSMLGPCLSRHRRCRGSL